MNLTYEENKEVHRNLWCHGGISGHSNKVYNLHLVKEKDGRWRSFAEYGPNGGTLNPFPLAGPCGFDEAWTKLSQAYIAKTTGKGGKDIYKDMGETKVTLATRPPEQVKKAAEAEEAGMGPDLLPMLCALSIDADRYDGNPFGYTGPWTNQDAGFYLESKLYSMQQKWDKKRLLVLASKRLVAGVQKQGKPTDIPQVVVDRLKELCDDGTKKGLTMGLDGEIFPDHFVVYDIFMFGDQPWDGKPFLAARWAKLEEQLPAETDRNRGAVYHCSLWSTPKDKMANFLRFKKGRYEGVIFRYNNGLYKPGRSQYLIKCKNEATASFIVTGLRMDGKNSARVGLVDWPGFQTDVSLNGKPFSDTIAVGWIVDVDYLYAHQGTNGHSGTGAMSQAHFNEENPIRDDVSKKECVRAQLKFKREEDDE